jgi:PhzF family phenazine biosynthesis protein
MRAAIFQVDAFTTRRFAGNPAAVVLLDEFPIDSVLQNIAAENNLAETAFLVPAGIDFRLRWFTPTVEVPLCGHATLASAAVIMERLEPSRRVVTFHSARGLLTVRRTGVRYVMDFPARTVEPTQTSQALSAALRVEPIEVWVDDFNYLVLLEHARSVRQLAPDLAAIAKLDRGGVIATAPDDGAYDFVSRYFAPKKGILEDPVTGGAHCALAPYWAKRLGKRELHAHQASQRGGELICRTAGERVEIEGSCVFYLQGEIEF